MKDENPVAYIVQEEVRTEISHLVEGKSPVPKTAAIPEVEWLRQFSRNHILGQPPGQVLHIPDEEVTRWGLRDGDELTLGSDINIIAVNGITSDGVSKARPHIAGPYSIRPGYPSRRLLVEKFGDTTLRAFTLLAPLGKGQRLFVVAPAWAGKSVVARALWKACLRLTLEDGNLFVIALQVGERGEDATELYIPLGETPHRKGRAEIYQSPDADSEDAHFFMAEYVINRARRLTESGYDVVLIVDSFSRVLMSHSRSDKILKPPSAGMIAGGISTASIAAIRRLLSVGGDFQNEQSGGSAGSLTVVATMLKDERGSHTRTSESVLFEETGASTSTAIWGLVNIPALPHPRIDVSITQAREYERICTPHQLNEMRMVSRLMWDDVEEKGGIKRRARAEDALDRLQKYAAKYPVDGR